MTSFGDLPWGQNPARPENQKVVAITATDAANLAKYIVENVSSAVIKQAGANAVEQYKQPARLEIDLSRAREERDRVVAENASLREYIGRLQGFLTQNVQQAAILPPVSAPAYPYQNGGSAYPAPPTYQVPFPTSYSEALTPANSTS